MKDEQGGQAEVDELCEDLHRRRPAWVTGGSLSLQGTRFLAHELLQSQASTAVEVGTASGFSAAVLAAVLDHGRRQAVIQGPIAVASFDANERWWIDPDRLTGEAAKELVPGLAESITFHIPATASDIANHFDRGCIRFLFIDANHAHPWPTLDLMMAWPSLAAGATVVFDDVNLPVVAPEFSGWGAHHVFYDVRADKVEGAFSREGTPLMGSIRLPDDKDSLREDLLRVLDAHEWQREVPEPYVAEARRRVT